MNRLDIIRELTDVNTKIEEGQRLVSGTVKERDRNMEAYHDAIEETNIILISLSARRKELLAMADKLNGVKA